MKRQHGMATVWQAGMVAALALAGVARGQDWPCFTGPDHDNTQPGAKGLAAEWPTNGPAVVWESKITGGGNGSFSSPVVAGGKVFVIGRAYKMDAPGKKIAEASPDVLHCLNASDGKELWQQEFPFHVVQLGEKTAWNTPIVDGDLVYARGPDGELRAIAVKDGKTAWTWPRDPATMTNKTASGYSLSAPSVIVDDVLIVPLFGGFKAKLVGLDKKTGELKWDMPEFGCWQFSAGCMIPMDLGGGKKVVVIGGFAFDPKTGKNLMPMVKDDKGRSVRAGLPVGINWVGTCKGNKLISGYVVNGVKEKVDGKDVVKKEEESGVGCVELSLNEDGTLGQKLLWKTVQTGNNRKWQKTYGGPVVQGDNVYVFHGGNDTHAISCVSMADGKVLWTEEKPKHDWGFSNVVGADGKIFYHQGGRLTMLAADPAAYKVLASAKMSAGNWSTPAIVGTHWFQFYDQPTSGRFDGENYQTGLLDIADTPYAEVIAACRYMGHSLYQIRSVLAAQPTRKDGAER